MRQRDSGSVVGTRGLREGIDRVGTSRLAGDVDEETSRSIGRLIRLAVAGLSSAFLPDTTQVVQTLRAVTTSDGVRLRAEGTSDRYGSIAALGLARLSQDAQRDVLHGRTAGDLAHAEAIRATSSLDVGSVALAAWAQAEVNGVFAEDLFVRLRAFLADGVPLTTVSGSWLVTAAAAASGLGGVDDLLEEGVGALAPRQGRHGIFPHHLSGGSSRWRGHVGSFADQVYPVQALARASVVTGNTAWLDMADRTAERICHLQGARGQWWWHYDARTGAVVEKFPVYSVHQHAMAPMVLFDLLEAGGADHSESVRGGVAWLEEHPETLEELVSERWNLVWRKVGRREPRKAARGLGAAATAVRPRATLPALDRLLPPGVVDHECRPYELGWMLYAWLPGGADDE